MTAAERLSSIRDNSCGAPEHVSLPQRRTPFALNQWSRRVSLFAFVYLSLQSTQRRNDMLARAGIAKGPRDPF
jgi:hypothetical protein